MRRKPVKFEDSAVKFEERVFHINTDESSSKRAVDSGRGEGDKSEPSKRTIGGKGRTLGLLAGLNLSITKKPVAGNNGKGL